MLHHQGKHTLARASALALLLAALTAAAGDWVVFKGQVNGPVKDIRARDLSTFALRKFPGLFWMEGYYHHLNFPDGSMITFNIGFNPKQADLALVYGKPGMKPLREYLIVSLDEVKFDPSGFGWTLGKNRARLDGDRYTLDLDFNTVQAKIEYQIMAPPYSYGDGMLRYPDGKSYGSYTLPIPWAKVHVNATLAGKKYELTGSGNMNHDALSLFPTYIPSQWQDLWFFGEDHALAVADFYTHPEFGSKLVQRLVFVDRSGRMFTSTAFTLRWDDWADAKDIPFRYPRHYTLTAEGQGDKLEAVIVLRETLLLEDLYSNLPTVLRVIAEKLTKNGWTLDSWSEYTIAYTHDGQTDTYRGRGVVRFTDLEQDKK
jgi:hypothetical protein